MAREGRNILAWVFKNFINSLKPRQFQGNFMGKDYLGNEYYEIPRSASRSKTSRWYVPKNKDEDQFDKPLPSEWESWLRYRRREPPTEEEIAENLAVMKAKEINAAELAKKYGTDQTSAGSSISYPQYDEYEKWPGKKPDQH